jgi:hypothetical protein
MPSSSNFNIDESNEDDSLRAAIEISKQEEVERILRKFFILLKFLF